MANSAVDFATKTRIHVGLGVTDLQASIDFYATLFDQEATKLRPLYAKFEVAEPPVNLTLNEVRSLPQGNDPARHFGIQVKSTDAVRRVADRLRAAGATLRAEEGTTCCYAVQDKVWTGDPDGNSWEVFVVLDADAPVHSAGREPDAECCTPQAGGCC